MYSIAQLIRRAMQVNHAGMATEFGGRRRTWAELGERVARLAAGLQRLGLQPGDRVAMLALNSDRYFEYLFAVAWAGGVFVPINTRLAPPEIVYWLNDSGSTMFFVGDPFLGMLPELRAQLAAVREFVHVGDGPPPAGFTSFEGLIEKHPPVPAAGRQGDDLAGLYYTGGTTGRSKGVMLSHRNLVCNALQTLAAFECRQSDVFLHVAPMFHLADGAVTMAAAMLAAGNCFLERFDPVATLRAIARHRATKVGMVPTMINLVASHPEVKAGDLSSLDGILYGASPMPEAVIRKAMEVIPRVQFFQAYGQSEASPVLTVLGPECHVLAGPRAGQLKSAGRAVPGVDVAILDENDDEVPRGTVGQICARGENVMLGYWNMPELTSATLKGGWLHTGDAGYMDEDGFLYVVDRLKGMIVSGGENVYSTEVEDAIYRHPAVAECAVIGIPHPEWGEQVHAVVRLKEDEVLDEAALIAHCRSLIASYKCPRSVEFRREPLPLSGAGKILKAELRRPYWEGQERAVH